MVPATYTLFSLICQQAQMHTGPSNKALAYAAVLPGPRSRHKRSDLIAPTILPKYLEATANMSPHNIQLQAQSHSACSPAVMRQATLA